MNIVNLIPSTAEALAARERWLAAEERAREASWRWIRAMTGEDVLAAREQMNAADAARDEAAEAYAAAGRALEAHAEAALGAKCYAALRRAIVDKPGGRL